ncbi:MAG: hypothetical protein JNM56_16295 [Planctomycetia bacterium]|nr:hypothetical protein [Planctomycetia bacterium]
MSVVSRVLQFCKVAVRTAFDVFVIQPLQGLQQVLSGAAQAGPELAQAAASAAVDAVQRRLSLDGQARVRQGGELILAGAKQLAAPAAMALGFWLCWNPGVLYLATATWVFVLALCLVA